MWGGQWTVGGWRLDVYSLWSNRPETSSNSVGRNVRKYLQTKEATFCI